MLGVSVRGFTVEEEIVFSANVRCSPFGSSRTNLEASIDTVLLYMHTKSYDDTRGDVVAVTGC